MDHLDPSRESPPIHSTIVVDESARTRTIFFELPDDGFGGDRPPEDVIRSARVLFIDHYDADRTIRAARIARARGIPVVADFERDDGPRFDELRGLPDHLIVSRDFAEKLTGEPDPARAVEALWSPFRPTNPASPTDSLPPPGEGGRPDEMRLSSPAGPTGAGIPTPRRGRSHTSRRSRSRSSIPRAAATSSTAPTPRRWPGASPGRAHPVRLGRRRA